RSLHFLHLRFFLLFHSTRSYRVRQSSRGRWWFNCEFQSTHSYRVRQKRTNDLKKKTKFQSTHSYRVRLVQKHHPIVAIYHFNPRTRIECDWTKQWRDPKEKEFQSTHSYRVRLTWLSCVLAPCVISIHALV